MGGATGGSYDGPGFSWFKDVVVPAGAFIGAVGGLIYWAVNKDDMAAKEKAAVKTEVPKVAPAPIDSLKLK
jgi:hypothetical protein